MYSTKNGAYSQTKQDNDHEADKKRIINKEPQPKQIKKRVGIETYLALITFLFIICTSIVKLTSKLCKRSLEIDLQRERIEKLERICMYNQNEGNEILAFILDKVCDLERKFESYIKEINNEIDSLNRKLDRRRRKLNIKSHRSEN